MFSQKIITLLFRDIDGSRYYDSEMIYIERQDSSILLTWQLFWRDHLTLGGECFSHIFCRQTLQKQLIDLKDAKINNLSIQLFSMKICVTN
jgi:hypothetical protein